MTHGIDTDFLVAAEIMDHPHHRQASELLRRLLDDGHQIAMVPQTLTEFIHVVTDPRRMPQPLTLPDAVNRAEHWWLSEEVMHVFPAGESVTDFVSWLRRHRLGRKRLLDTLFAATLRAAGVRHIITNNERDFQVFGCFEVVTFR